MIRIKYSRSVSRVLYLKDEVFVICLLLMLPTGSSDLPPDIGRATLRASVYMVLQLISSTAPCITTGTGKLLPHLFTLTPVNRSGYFLLPYSALTNSFLLGNMMLYVARTFLFLPFGVVSDKPICCISFTKILHLNSFWF